MTILKTRITREEWEAVASENQVARDMKRMTRHAEQVAEGTRPVAYFCGIAGVGKSRSIREGLKIATAKGIEPIFCNPENYKDIIDAYKRASGKRPVVFEEADQVLNSPRMINLLKLATDENGPRTVETRKGKVKLNAPTMMASNRNMNDDSLFEHDISALRSRAEPLVINSAPLALWEYACHLAICRDMIRNTNKGLGIPVAVQNKALEWFTVNLWRMEDVSPRRLRTICMAIYRYHGKVDGEEMWQADLQPMLKRPKQSNFIPEIPTIIVPSPQTGESAA